MRFYLNFHYILVIFSRLVLFVPVRLHPKDGLASTLEDLRPEWALEDRIGPRTQLWSPTENSLWLLLFFFFCIFEVQMEARTITSHYCTTPPCKTPCQPPMKAVTQLYEHL